jgi:predicted ArsR family transcriptional regulator
VVRSAKPERIHETTRGRVLALLRRGEMTADELAEALGLTDNAVRAHLATLERDGFVQAQGERRDGRVGKPATLYRIAAEAEPLFSKAYLPLLTSLLASLGERLSAEDLASLLTDVGNRMAAEVARPSGDLSSRAQAASSLLNQLGGLSTIEEVEPGVRYLIQARGCPVGVAVQERAEVCEAIVSLLSELTGAKVRSCCVRTGRPSCCFEVGAPPMGTDSTVE